MLWHGTDGAGGCAGRPASCGPAGNRRQRVFFSDEDFETYRDMPAESCRAARVSVLAWCLMANHVHLILLPKDEDGLRAALADAHRRYSRTANWV